MVLLKAQSDIYFEYKGIGTSQIDPGRIKARTYICTSNVHLPCTHALHLPNCRTNDSYKAPPSSKCAHLEGTLLASSADVVYNEVYRNRLAGVGGLLHMHAKGERGDS